jgi:glycosyltransferase involved in cell wall biosynthesis
VEFKADERLEVIVVDDGSTDNTAKIAGEFCEKMPNIFRLIQKQNGGHGSAVNAGLENADGKYFKVVDADDATEPENLIKLIDVLEKNALPNNIDTVVNSFSMLNATNGKLTYSKVDCEFCEKITNLDEVMSVYDKIGGCFTIHSLTYKTSLLKGLGLKLSEGVFYEDNEYAILPFLNVNSLLLLPFVVYIYTIGQATQSISVNSQVARISHKETVIRKITDTVNSAEISRKTSRREFLKRRILALFTGYMVTAFLMEKSEKQRKLHKAQLDRLLSSAGGEYSALLQSKYRLIRFCGRLRFPVSLYEKIVSQNFLRQKLRKFLNKK